MGGDFFCRCWKRLEGAWETKIQDTGWGRACALRMVVAVVAINEFHGLKQIDDYIVWSSGTIFEDLKTLIASIIGS